MLSVPLQAHVVITLIKRKKEEEIESDNAMLVLRAQNLFPQCKRRRDAVTDSGQLAGGREGSETKELTRVA